jgi:predicted transcriptional regulator
MRRPRVDWMTGADDAILEWMLNEPVGPIRASPGMVESNLDYEISHVRTRMIELREAGLLEYYDEDRGIYQITDRGRAYLAGELDAEDLDRDKTQQ